ncbi:hypothetical protein CU633_14080 [Bacillus sp. V3-13]|uniref:SIR2 family protein n=1 Tax=Bacillus sp. V3-13 TaxID=2053728 RepID=UPI000C77AA25|nr:SIR2 family protein [Bacillus sp. V3-13]PLR76760.1 hypothetical protein CU633_14080 [Bacillus sp. V3-13]
MSEIQCLNYLIESNEYPIIFIGSGISKRYLKDYPGWLDLLNEFWEIIEPEEDFFAFLNQTKNGLKEKLNDSSLDYEYLTFIELGTYIENRYNKLFFDSKVTIEGFTQKEAFFSGISPFKHALSIRFSEYEIKQEMYEEIQSFKKLLNKAQIVLTTNYDTFAEDCTADYGTNRLKKYVGQKGFFRKSSDWGEIFKIHGCISEPESIVISREDYKRFDKNCVLISAKIISLLISSPIIFLGYSLTDRNIRKIIRDFSSSLSGEEKEFMKDRIIIVNRKEGLDQITEFQRQDDDLECTYTIIETDNFSLLYNELLNINQGAYPSEVRKFQELIRAC